LVALEWLPATLVVLAQGPKHYAELLDEVGALNPSDGWNRRHARLYESTLTRVLRRLTADGLVVRSEQPGVLGPTVRYSLTSAAAELLDAVRPLAEWAQQHHALVETARLRRWNADDSDPPR
jgi:DNA-binding HxlR family transcriptional regulator